MKKMSKRRANGAGTIRHRADGRWEGKIFLGYRSDGKPHRKSILARTQADCQQRMTEALHDLRLGRPQVDERQTVKQFLTNWLEQTHKPNVGPRTYLKSEQVVRLHVLPELGHVRLSKLTPLQVQTLLNRKLKSGLAPRTVHHIHGILHNALNQGVRWGEVTRNVASLVPAPRVQSEPVQPFTPEEAKIFLGAVAGERLEALFVLAIATGLRQGELLGLALERCPTGGGEVERPPFPAKTR